MKNLKLILASMSPRRKEILSMLKLPFKTIPANIEEKVNCIEDVSIVAAEKADFIYSKNPESTVIGADTVVVLDKKILEKPKNKKEAFDMLKALSGNTHRVITCVAIINNKNKIVEKIETKVQVEKLSDLEIKDYIENEDIMDAAGAYKIQGSFSKFIKSIEGEYLNVVGLPLGWLYRNLKKLSE